jgi:hypothetical protein
VIVRRLGQLGRSSLISQTLISFTAAVTLGACTGGSASSPSSGPTVSGTLTQTTVSGVDNDPVTAFENKSATTGTSVSLDCGAKGVFTAVVDSTTGAFSVAGVPTGVPCSFNFVNSTSKVTKCQVQFQDSSSYDLNHNAMSSNSATPSGSVSMGAITCDTSGIINVATTAVPGVDAGGNISSATAFDFSGVWTAAAFDGTLPASYATIGATGGNGPTIGDKINLVRFHGVKFTPNSGQCTPTINVTCPVSSGTTDVTKEGYAMSIWGGDYAHGIGACGGNTGFTRDEARAYAGLDLDATAPSVAGNPLTYAHYTWSTPSGFGTNAGTPDAGWTQPWMYAGARSQFDVQDCQPVSVPSKPAGTTKGGYACFASTVTSGTPTGTYRWSVGLNNAGGCVDSSGNPLMVNNWSGITFGTCTSAPNAFNSDLTTQSCTYTGAVTAGGTSQTFTCSYTGGTFTDLSGGTTSSDNNGPNFGAPITLPAGTWNGQPGPLLALNATCKGATTEAALIGIATGGGTASAKAAASKELLYRYQCYANAYWKNTQNGAGSTSCARNYNFDWSTNDYSKFITGDDRSMKPQNAFITDRVFYSPDGQWGFLKNSDTRYQSIPTASGSTLCPMQNVTELKFNRVNDSKILVNFTQKTVMADRSTTCQGAVAAAIAGGGTLASDPTGLNNLYNQLKTSRFLFYLTK